MRLIDADEIQKNMPNTHTPTWVAVKAILASMPTVDAVPVVHAEWLLRHIGHGHYWECSHCHQNPCIYVTENTKFCPNCGAKMDEKR